MYRCRADGIDSKFRNELSQPNGFVSCCGDSHVFGLHGRKHNCRLLSGVLSDGHITNLEDITSEGPAVQLVVCKVGV